MGWQCMERNLILITFPADFISLLRHEVSEDGIWYLFRLHPSSPAPVPYGHKLAHNVIPGLLIIVRWKRVLSLGIPCAGQTNTRSLTSLSRLSYLCAIIIFTQRAKKNSPKNVLFYSKLIEKLCLKVRQFKMSTLML